MYWEDKLNVWKTFQSKVDMYEDSMRMSHWRTQVVFISIFKDSSHSVCTQLGGPYLWAALLKGEGVFFSREDSIPLLCQLLSSAEWCSGDNVNLITTCECVLYEWCGWRPAISPRICTRKNWLRARFGQLQVPVQSEHSRSCRGEKRLFRDLHINI